MSTGFIIFYTLTETKNKGNGVEILGPYLHFYSGVPKEKRKDYLF